MNEARMGWGDLLVVGKTLQDFGNIQQENFVSCYVANITGTNSFDITNHLSGHMGMLVRNFLSTTR